MNKYEARFNSVKKWYKEFIDKGKLNNCQFYQFDDDMYPIESLILDETGLYVKIINTENRSKISMYIFNSDTDYDDGMQTNIKTMRETLKEIRLFKEL